MDTVPIVNKGKLAQQKLITSECLADKRKSLGVFKAMDIEQLTVIRDRLTDVLDVKVQEAEQKALVERAQKVAIDDVINKTIAHLELQGLKFNRQQVAKLLVDNVKLGQKPLSVAVVSQPLKKPYQSFIEHE
ncbi:MAG: hypothetical protein ACJAU1_001651 [Psychromonas sp.]